MCWSHHMAAKCGGCVSAAFSLCIGMTVENWQPSCDDKIWGSCTLGSETCQLLIQVRVKQTTLCLELLLSAFLNLGQRQASGFLLLPVCSAKLGWTRRPNPKHALTDCVLERAQKPTNTLMFGLQLWLCVSGVKQANHMCGQKS